MHIFASVNMSHPVAELIISWYLKHRRDLPWRNTKDAYKIWLSEVILHQTRVSQGLPYYEKYVERYPDIQSLAAAPEEEVLRLWQGLGYYSRARNMHRTAKEVVEKYDGQFPSSPDAIRKLKGVGDYTTAAIASFAFDLPLAVVDGNVMRVLSRLYAIDAPINSSEGRAIMKDLAEALLPADRAGLYNQAIMEFGALQCVPAKPACDRCLLMQHCAAYQKGAVQAYPVKNKNSKKRQRYFNYLIIICGHKVWMRRRSTGDIWAGLYEFELIEADKLLDFNELQEKAAQQRESTWPNTEFSAIFNDLNVWQKVGQFKHVLTHQQIFAQFYLLKVDEGPVLNSNNWHVIDRVEQLPKPILIDKVWKLITRQHRKDHGKF